MSWIREALFALTRRLPVKVMRGPDGVPFLERYHLIGADQGPGLVIHRFCGSDPDRGFHDHPWAWSLSLVLHGAYEELKLSHRGPLTGARRVLRAGGFNLIDGRDYHRVMLTEPPHEAWTLFVYGPRRKTWGFVSGGRYTPYARTVKDLDGGWWREAR